MEVKRLRWLAFEVFRVLNSLNQENVTQDLFARNSKFEQKQNYLVILTCKTIFYENKSMRVLGLHNGIYFQTTWNLQRLFQVLKTYWKYHLDLNIGAVLATLNKTRLHSLESSGNIFTGVVKTGASIRAGLANIVQRNYSDTFDLFYSKQFYGIE